MGIHLPDKIFDFTDPFREFFIRPCIIIQDNIYRFMELNRAIAFLAALLRGASMI
jgi:hypothetical protein